MLTNLTLATGKIMHRRFTPKVNHFNYRSEYVAIPLERLMEGSESPDHKSLDDRPFSSRRFSLFRLDCRDYGPIETPHQSFTDLKQWLLQTLRQHGIGDPTHQQIHQDHSFNNNNLSDSNDHFRFVLVTHPKCFGYVFNPVSFWLCYDQREILQAVLCEVNNTCNQRHFYLCQGNSAQGIQNDEWLTADKHFYVSPFLAVEGRYEFRFDITDEHMDFYINHFKQEQLILATYLKCRLQPYSGFNVFKVLLKSPFFTFKTSLLIHYQALKLALKRITIYRCPPRLKKNISTTDHPS